jgi:hypothetical protein
MIVRCNATRLDETYRRRVGGDPKLHTDFQLTIGKEYIVLGITFVVQSPICGSGILFDLEDDFGFCFSTPAQLFDIVDPRPSAYWMARRFGDDDLALWPEEFYRPSFHDRLSDGHQEERIAFRDLVSRLTAESTSVSAAPVPE